MPSLIAPDHQRIIAKALHGEPLWALVQQCAKAVDVGFLTVMREEGCFGVDRQSLFAESNPIHLMHPASVPAIDALAAVLANAEVQLRVYPTSLLNEPRHPVSFVRPDVSDEMQGFLREVFASAARSFEAIWADGLSQDEAGTFDAKREATVSAMVAVAAATDDFTMFKEVTQGLSASDWSERLRPIHLCDGDVHRTFSASPAAYAIRFDATHVLAAMVEAFPRALDCLGLQMNGNGFDVVPMSLYGFMNKLDLEPSPEMARLLIQGLKQHDGNYASPGREWVQDTLWWKATNGEWPHLLDVAIEGGAFAADPEKAADRAAVMGLAPLMSHAIEASRHGTLLPVKFPPMESFVGALNDPDTPRFWFPTSHPVRRMLGHDFDGQSAQGHADATMQILLSEMGDRGLLGEAMQARDQANFSLSDHCVAKKLNGALSVLVDEGLDLDAPVARSGRSMEEDARLMGNDVAVRMIRSARARQAALAALGGFDGPAVDQFSYRGHQP